VVHANARTNVFARRLMVQRVVSNAQISSPNTLASTWRDRSSSGSRWFPTSTRSPSSAQGAPTNMGTGLLGLQDRLDVLGGVLYV
jgi:hypothetical protein